MRLITPVLLCGGAGTRLWPLSRASLPKQFAVICGDQTLFQLTARRLHGSGFAAPLIITHTDFRFIVAKQLAAVGVDPGPVLLEPEGRNTAPAILAAALHLAAVDPGRLMLVVPSDHVIPDEAAFRAVVATGVAAALAGDLVTFGISPTRAETGFGYLETRDMSALCRVRRFVEKPAPDEAARMVASGQYLWNAGIFLATAATMLAAFRAHAPQLFGPVQAALADARADLGSLRLAPAPWAKTEAVSVDYAVMEHAKNLSVVRYTGEWSDLGSWEAVWRASAPDAEGVATVGAAQALGCRDTLLHADGGGPALIGMGLEGIIAVSTPDAVLVADRRCAQEVRRVVEVLGLGAGAGNATLRHLAGGTVEVLAAGLGYTLRRVVLYPGGVMHTQAPLGWGETWRLVSGEAQLVQGEWLRKVAVFQAVDVAPGAAVTVENPGDVPAVWVVMQVGNGIAGAGEDTAADAAPLPREVAHIAAC
ncbi:mannose-1-phosphate guanylyltransferase/mannose-6-phosphate isomerase [Phaeovulum sp.]|uniref:mannose-1-phosphate guanylyltransferase/mannose-6-phosphate isomerase n=1 Tax=Phaeovulum sp. TaxID=2934796 RepID=UPI0039E52B9D